VDLHFKVKFLLFLRYLTILLPVCRISSIIFLCTASLYHRNPESTRMSCYSCCAHSNDKKYTLQNCQM
jgi:hypothetical protein